MNQFVLLRNIALGYPIRSFSIQVYSKSKWKTIYSGTAIGNKYIFLAEKPIATKRIRLVINESVGEPEITSFSVFTIKNNTNL